MIDFSQLFPCFYLGHFPTCNDFPKRDVSIGDMCTTYTRKIVDGKETIDEKSIETYVWSGREWVRLIPNYDNQG